MLKKIISMLLVICLMSTFVPVFATDTVYPATFWTDYAADGFAGGTGTENAPYLIETAEQLAYLAKITNDGYFTYHIDGDGGYDEYMRAYFSQIADIDVDNHLWVSIGAQHSFPGHYNGNGFSIKNLTINAVDSQAAVESQQQGLFGSIDDATIENVNLLNVNVFSENECIGAVATHNVGSLIRNCHVEGTVKGKSAGGLIGTNDGWIENSSFQGSVIATDHAAGLCAVNWGDLTDCFATGTVLGGDETGGLIGYSNMGWIKSCYYMGTVSGENEVGGLMGYGYDITLENCYAKGTVSGKEKVGGLAGNLVYVAGLINSYSAVTIGGYNDIGGLYGYLQNISELINTNCRYNNTLNPTLTSIGGMTEGEMQSKDFLELLNGTQSPTPWVSDTTPPINDGYPILAWQLKESIVFPTTYWTDYAANGFAGGTGTEADPYLIETAEQLAYLAKATNDGTLDYSNYPYFEQIADIDLNSQLWMPIGVYYQYDDLGQYIWVNNGFKGNYDGCGFSVSSLTIFANESSSTKNYELGLFGCIDSALIENVKLLNVNIYTENVITYDVGSLAAKNVGTVVKNCTAEGNVRSGSSAGGLIGTNDGWIENSSFSGDVVSNGRAAGLCAVNWGYLTDCFATGRVSGGDGVGGLAGYSSDGIVSRCYFNGAVSGENVVGGLIGYSGGEHIGFSYMVGTVTGKSKVGGIAGYVSGEVYSFSAYSAAAITGDEFVGGVYGDANIVEYPDEFRVKGILYYDSTLNPLLTDEYGKSTEELKSTEFVTLLNNRLGEQFWRTDITPPVNDGYPILAWQLKESSEFPTTYWTNYAAASFAGGTGTSDDPYLIETAEQLAYLAKTTNDGYLIYTDKVVFQLPYFNRRRIRLW